MRGLAIAAAILIVAAPASGHWTASRPDGHAPIGVMGDHTHNQGEWMISYRFMSMDMEGSRSGSNRITDREVTSPNGAGFLVTPTRMTMGMHMFGLMYAPTDALTLMAMIPNVDLSMDHLTRAGSRFSTSASGLGDVRLVALLKVLDREGQRVHLNLGVSAPTGSIDRRDVTPMSAPNRAQLPYPMQLGSGTWDALAGATALGQVTAWSWGGQALSTIRTGRNDRGYTLGNRLEATTWLARRASRSWSISGRAAWADWEDIDGSDSALAGAVGMRVVPTAFPDLRGGSRLDLGVGINYEVMDGRWKGLRLATEYLVPAAQSLAGPQLETDSQWVVGIQYSR